MSPLHFNLTDRWTSPEPRNCQSTWDSRPQPRRWCQHLQGRGRSDGSLFDSRRDSWTGWSPYLLPGLWAVSRGWRWLATRTQLPSPEGSRISVWSRTWRSTTLSDQNRVSLVIITDRRVQAWFHSRRRRRHTRFQQVLPGHLFWRQF